MRRAHAAGVPQLLSASWQALWLKTSVCAQALLDSDDIPYSLFPVGNYSEMQATYRRQQDDVSA